MSESRINLTDRLRKEGRWDEASVYRDEVRRRLKTEGKPRAEANNAAWAAMSEKFPPLPEEPAPPPPDATSDLFGAFNLGLRVAEHLLLDLEHDSNCDCYRVLIDIASGELTTWEEAAEFEVGFDMQQACRDQGIKVPAGVKLGPYTAEDVATQDRRRENRPNLIRAEQELAQRVLGYSDPDEFESDFE